MNNVIELGNNQKVCIIRFEDRLLKLVESLNGTDATYLEIIGALEIRKIAIYRELEEVIYQEGE